MTCVSTYTLSCYIYCASNIISLNITFSNKCHMQWHCNVLSILKSIVGMVQHINNTHRASFNNRLANQHRDYSLIKHLHLYKNRDVIIHPCLNLKTVLTNMILDELFNPTRSLWCNYLFMPKAELSQVRIWEPWSATVPKCIVFSFSLHGYFQQGIIKSYNIRVKLTHCGRVTHI